MFCKDTLKGRRVLVTGGGGGLGRSLVKTLLSYGASYVAICGRKQETLDAAIGEFSEWMKEEGISARVAAFSCDVGKFDEVDRLFTAIEADGGEVDCLINNAAKNVYTTADARGGRLVESIVSTVLNGTIFCSDRFAKALIKVGKPGRIVHIATTYARRGAPYVSLSAAAKAGVVTFSESMAVEFGEHQITSNAIAPGPFPTKGAWDRLVPNPEAFEPLMKSQIPLGRFVTREEIGTLITFLFSPMGGFITGQLIAIDGGEQLVGSEFEFLYKMPAAERNALFESLRPKGRSGNG